jgi:hypothetical protein
MHYFIGIVIGLVVGGGLSYAFRGKEHAIIAAAGSDVKGAVDTAASSIDKKL